MKSDGKIAATTAAGTITTVLLIIAAIITAFILRFMYNNSLHVPNEGIWGCDEPYVRIYADEHRIEIEEDGRINEYNIAWGDELNYEIGIEDDGGVFVTGSGSIELHGGKVHLKSNSGYIDVWLTKIEE